MFRSICLFHSVPTWITHMFFWCDSLDLDAAMSKFDSLARNCTWPITSSAAFRTAVVSRDAQGTCTAHEHQQCQPRIHKPFFMNDGGILQIVIICVKNIYIYIIHNMISNWYPPNSAARDWGCITCIWFSWAATLWPSCPQLWGSCRRHFSDPPVWSDIVGVWFLCFRSSFSVVLWCDMHGFWLLRVFFRVGSTWHGNHDGLEWHCFVLPKNFGVSPATIWPQALQELHVGSAKLETLPESIGAEPIGALMCTLSGYILASQTHTCTFTCAHL